MNKLSSINIKVEECVEPEIDTGNALPLLNEIRYAMEKLLDTNQSTIIDLRSIPMAPGEEDYIEKILGAGEVSAQLNALGPSDIYETKFAGVWLVVHYNSNKEIIGKLIEITRMPSILFAQTEDVKQGLVKITRQLDSILTTNDDSAILCQI